MRKIDRLRLEALDACKFRGHEMGPFHRSDRALHRRTATSECGTCGMMVGIDERPLPNGIEIGGEAVASGCAMQVRS